MSGGPQSGRQGGPDSAPPGAAVASALPLSGLPAAGRWAALLTLSLVLGGVLQWAGLPGAIMLGPLAAAIVVESAGGTVKVPRLPMLAAQAVVGVFVAQSITAAIVAGFVRQWPLFLGVVLLTVAAATALGFTLSRLRIIPGHSTAVWGLLPGAATVMMLMAEEYGADFRLVAFMQYLRVVLVAAVASVVALVFVHGGGGGRFAAGLLPPVDPANLASTVAVTVVGAALGRLSRLPAGILLGPLVLGAVLNVLGVVAVKVPPALLIASFALIGWNTGLRFTGDALAAAARALPQSVGAMIVLIAFCGLVAWGLVALAGIDPLTAYLATSPGGLDAAAVIAASTRVDMAFVMAVQAVRLVILIVAGPALGRWVAGMLEKASPRP